MEFDSKESERQFNFDLIEFVRQNEVLYDPKHKDSRDNGVKVAIFKKFAEEHNMECEFVMRRWSNLRNSYQRIKRETRHIPDADGHQKSGKVWAFYQSLKFLDSVGSTFYSNRTSSASTSVRKKRKTNHHAKINVSNGHKIGENELLFTQTLDTYSDDNASFEDEGTEPSNSETALNTNDLLQFNTSILSSINDLSTNIKELIGQQQIAKLTQKNQFESNDSISLYLNSLRILLEPLSNDHLKFAKLQLKINQLVIDEIEKAQSHLDLS